MSVLLTGATGFLGNNLLRELNARNRRVLALLRQDRGIPALKELDFEPIPGDLSSLEQSSLDSIPYFDVCIHSAAMINIGWTRVAEARKINVAATRQLAKLCQHRGARLVFVSTINTLACSRDPMTIHTELNREPACPPFCYSVTKREAELEIEELVSQGLDAVVVHPGFLLGRWDWKPSSAEMLLAVARTRPPFAPGGGSNAVDVRDVVDGILRAAERGRRGENYILGGNNISYFELWCRMAETAGVRKPRVRLPSWLAMTGGYAGDLWGKIRRNEGPLNSAASRMGQLFHYYSSAKAEQELGYQPREIDESIRLTYQWVVEQGWLNR